MAVGKPAYMGAAEEVNERLLVEAAQKDPAKFDELYEINFERVYSYIAWRVRNRDVAEDLTSEVFQKALEYLPRFTWRGVPFAAWLLRIASNLLADRSKRAAKEFNIVDLEEATEVTQFSLDEVEERARLFRLVIQLPADQRRVIEMRFADEKSIKQIGQELGRTEGAIKQLQFRGLQNLRAHFVEQLGEKNG